MLKIWSLSRTVVCVRGFMRVCVWWGGGQDVITIQTSTMMTRNRLQYHVCRPPAVLADGAVVTNAFYSHNACWYMRALNIDGNEHRR